MKVDACDIITREKLEKKLKGYGLSGKVEAYIFGTGHIAGLYNKGLERANRIDIKGYCVSSPQGSTYNGYSLRTLDEIVKLESHPLILVCSWQKGIYQDISEKYGEMAKILNIDAAIFSLYSEDVLRVYDNLYDEESKQTYAHIIMCRCNLQMPDDAFTNGESYFSIPEARRYGNEVFLDCGAYVGDTIEQYISKKPTFKKIIAFEPDRKNFNAMLARIERLRTEWGIPQEKIVIENLGVGKKQDRQFITSGNGNGSLISNDGDAMVDIVSIDEYVRERIDFIAADVESFEYDMLIGATNTLCKYRPLVAVSIYHNAMDMFQIPLCLLKMVPEYALKVKHNTVTYDDTILYAFLPRSNEWIQ